MLYKLTLQGSVEEMEAYDVLLEEEAVSTSWFETSPFSDIWQFEALFDHAPDLDLYKAQALAGNLPWVYILCEPLAEKNWLEENRKSFQPIVVGSFFIHDSCYTGPFPHDGYRLVIDAATAFGTGHHATTRLCLQLLLKLKDLSFRPNPILDLGCGTGILGMAAYHLWKTSVFLSDNDPEAVMRTGLNLEKNACQGIALVAEGFEDPCLLKNRPFDLILANVLAGPLIELAPSMAINLSSHGYAILSGILQDQAEGVIIRYESQGFKLLQHAKEDMWSALLFKQSI